MVSSKRSSRATAFVFLSKAVLRLAVARSRVVVVVVDRVLFCAVARFWSSVVVVAGRLAIVRWM